MFGKTRRLGSTVIGCLDIAEDNCPPVPFKLKSSRISTLHFDPVCSDILSIQPEKGNCPPLYLTNDEVRGHISFVRGQQDHSKASSENAVNLVIRLLLDIRLGLYFRQTKGSVLIVAFLPDSCVSRGLHHRTAGLIVIVSFHMGHRL